MCTCGGELCGGRPSIAAQDHVQVHAVSFSWVKAHAPAGSCLSAGNAPHGEERPAQPHPDNQEPTPILPRRSGPLNVVSRVVVTGAMADRLDGPFSSSWPPDLSAPARMNFKGTRRKVQGRTPIVGGRGRP
jgi:hypothetical protein